jgi:hypothetical protein
MAGYIPEAQEWAVVLNKLDELQERIEALEGKDKELS